MSKHVVSQGNDDHNLNNLVDHDYLGSNDANNIDTNSATNSANIFPIPSSVVTPTITPSPLSNSTNNATNVNNSLPQQSNMISDTNSVVMALIEQNRLLMEQLLLRRPTTPSPSVQSNISNGYYVMPDFHETLSNFIGTESPTEASNWMKSINSTADLHNWPDSFKLEIIRTKFKGAAHNWYLGRTFSDWEHFERQFRETFIGTQTSTVERTKLLIARHQRKGETIVEYFHDKARMCRELELNFPESKQQIVEGIYSRELCLYLLSRSHTRKNELLNDIVTFMKVNDPGNTRFKNSSRPLHPEATTKNINGQPEAATKPSTSDAYSKQSSQIKKTRCFNCGSFDHISTGCTKPKRRPGSCFTCGSIEHQITTCPQSKSKPQTVKTQNNSSSAAMLLHPKEMTLQEECEMLRMQFNNINNLNDHNKRGNSLFAEVDDKRQALTSELEMKREKYETLKKCLSKANHENNQMKMEMMRLEKQLLETERNDDLEKSTLIQSYKNRISDLEEKIRELDKRPETPQVLKIDNLSNDGMNVVLQIVSDVRKEKKALEEEMNRRSIRDMEARQQCFKGECEIRQLKKEMRRDKLQLKELEQQISALKSKLSSSKENIVEEKRMVTKGVRFHNSCKIEDGGPSLKLVKKIPQQAVLNTIVCPKLEDL